MKLLTIIPAHNEAECILDTIRNFKKVNPNLDFLVVNDGSVDDTQEILTKNNINHINLPTNIGLSGAVQAGIFYAKNHNYDAFLQYDGDGQHLPEYVKPMLEVLKQGNDIVIGSRFIDTKKPFSLRMLGSKILTLAILISCRRIIKDPTSGMRMFSSDIIKMFTENQPINLEADLLTWLIRNGYKIKEIPVKMIDRKTGSSYLNIFNSMFYMLSLVVTIILIQPFLPKSRKFKKGVK